MADGTGFLVEQYWPGITAEGFREAVGDVRRSAEELARAGVTIRLLHSTLVIDDEAAFCVFEAESREAVEQAYAAAGVTFDRVQAAVELVPSRSEGVFERVPERPRDAEKGEER